MDDNISSHVDSIKLNGKGNKSHSLSRLARAANHNVSSV